MPRSGNVRSSPSTSTENTSYVSSTPLNGAPASNVFITPRTSKVGAAPCTTSTAAPIITARNASGNDSTAPPAQMFPKQVQSEAPSTGQSASSLLDPLAPAPSRVSRWGPRVSKRKLNPAPNHPPALFTNPTSQVLPTKPWEAASFPPPFWHPPPPLPPAWLARRGPHTGGTRAHVRMAPAKPQLQGHTQPLRPPPTPHGVTTNMSNLPQDPLSWPPLLWRPPPGWLGGPPGRQSTPLPASEAPLTGAPLPGATTDPPQATTGSRRPRGRRGRGKGRQPSVGPLIDLN